MKPFVDKIVFVTGGAHGIGRAIVEAFCEAGACVAFCDIDIQSGQATATATKATFIEADVSCAEALESAMNVVQADLGEIDIVINNAGVGGFTPLIECATDHFDKLLATNLRPVFITSRRMAIDRNNPQGRNRYGRIVNIASTRWLQSEPHSEGYAASKGGIVALTHALALSLAEYNITVNCISPGWIDNGHFAPTTERDRRQHPSGRIGTTQDIARTCLFLCHPDNDFINGENIVVDGGMTRKMIYEE